jgi:UDP-N-acetylglucosamine 1-carboxyvinyltransferase
LCAATLARGQTILRGAAREPEIVDLGNFLQRLGARISGLGTSIVEVHGVEQLGAAEHELIPDRIEAGTLLAAAAATGGRAVLAGAVSAHLTRVLEVLSDAGASINTTGDSITLSSSHPLRCIRLVAAPYPDFPTDLQAPFTVLACLARGTSIIADHVFPDRFAHVAQLRRMGARIVVERKGNTTRSRIADASRLHGASVRAGDLRASAALVVAALAAQGETHIRGLQHLDRGYDDLAGKLRGWGAHLNRVDHDPPGFTLLRLHSKLAV